MPLVACLFLVAMPGTPSSVHAPSGEEMQLSSIHPAFLPQEATWQKLLLSLARLVLDQIRKRNPGSHFHTEWSLLE